MIKYHETFGVKPNISKKLLLFSILGITLALTSFSGEKNCKRHFSGKWRYDDLPTATIYVVRTKKKQFECTQNGKYSYEYDVKWLSNCKYQMTFVATNDPNPYFLKKGDILLVDILSITENEMTYKTIFKQKSDTGKMIKID